MKTITLEFSKLQILKEKERWKLYFVIVTEHPTDNDKMIVSTFPEPYIRLKPSIDNLISFEPEGSGETDGLFVIERQLPDDNRIKVRVYLRQCRQNIRSLGKSLQDLKKSLGGDAFEIVDDLLGTTVPWLLVAKKAVPMIGTVLSKIKDKDMGFVSMDESLKKEEVDQNCVLERANAFSTGEAKIWWKWKVNEL
ncbi:MAG TPA: hypothetical protein DHV48_16550 [Prolixibacteraceae bacterium]|nr:hypothetical protein [Prolixibacteraceae bacterium]